MSKEREIDGKFKKVYKINENFFSRIDTEQKAYILGFFYADGCNSIITELNKCVSFTQLEQDVDILNKIKIAMESTNILYEIIQKSNGKKKYILDIYSKKLSEDLEFLGATPNKSLTLTFPTENIPKELMHHFIRGYFDGDGCIWNGKPKRMLVKDKSKTSGFRERLVHNVKFTFTGNIYFIEPLQNFLIQELGFKKTKLNFSKSKDLTNSTCDKVCTMEYSGRGQIKKLYDYMYNNATIYGNRKKEKFEIINCAFVEKSANEISLNAENPLEL